MPAGQGDLIQAIDVQNYYGEEVLNIYYFRVVPITGLADPYLEVIADHVEDEIIAAFRPLQSARLTHTGIQVRNLTNNLDFLDRTISLAGTNTAAASDDQPSYVTFNYQLVRETLATRNGRKAVGGITGQYFDGNTVSVPVLLNTNMIAALSADVAPEPSLVTLAEPVIVGRPFTPPVAVGYRYSSIGSARLMGMGSQNTRKEGRGA